MIILKLTIIAPGNIVDKKLGNPQTWSEESASTAGPQPTLQPAPQPASTSLAPVMKNPVISNLDNSMLSSQMTHPISSLSPYQNKLVYFNILHD